jgi:hypothetical protein
MCDLTPTIQLKLSDQYICASRQTPISQLLTDIDTNKNYESAARIKRENVF